MSALKNHIVKTFFRITKFLVWRHTYSPMTYRTGMNFFTWFLARPVGVKYIRETVGNMDARWIRPAVFDEDSVILYLHGGGYGMGSIRSHRKLAARIARECRTQCLIIEYRLAPEHPFPAAVDDVETAYRWLLEKGYQPEKIVLGGDSAGGGLTIASLLRLRDQKLPLPLAGFCLSPWLDLEARNPDIDAYQKYDPFLDKESVRIWGKKYAGDHTRLPEASPIYASPVGLPPLLVQVGTSEIFLFENRLFYEQARKAGLNVRYEEYPEQVHVFQAFAGFLPEADEAICRIGAFVLEQAARSRNSSSGGGKNIHNISR